MIGACDAWAAYRWDVVELPAAMVGHDQAIHSGFQRPHCILGRQDALLYCFLSVWPQAAHIFARCRDEASWWLWKVAGSTTWARTWSCSIQHRTSSHLDQDGRTAEHGLQPQQRPCKSRDRVHVPSQPPQTSSSSCSPHLDQDGHAAELADPGHKLPRQPGVHKVAEGAGDPGGAVGCLIAPRAQAFQIWQPQTSWQLEAAHPRGTC